jgi:hypothetical protein
MTKEDWLINLENAACEVSERLGYSTVEFVLGKYGASSIEDLSEVDYPAVWDELSLMAEDD